MVIEIIIVYIIKQLLKHFHGNTVIFYSLSVMYIQIIKFDSWVAYVESRVRKYQFLRTAVLMLSHSNFYCSFNAKPQLLMGCLWSGLMVRQVIKGRSKKTQTIDMEDDLVL